MKVLLLLLFISVILATEPINTANPTASGLVKHAKMALNQHWGYVWGTFGRFLTEAELRAKIRQYPSQVGRYETFIRQHYLNKVRTCDCVGLIKSYLWWQNGEPHYKPATDKTADMFYSAAKVKGSISTIPEQPGVAVWHKGHIGVYIGNNRVIEAKGTMYGVVQTPLRGKGANSWTHWLKVNEIRY
ncbi:hypothetical protein GEMRC1_004473 [Eukaryota sp. GEM-RC1]